MCDWSARLRALPSRAFTRAFSDEMITMSDMAEGSTPPSLGKPAPGWWATVRDALRGGHHDYTSAPLGRAIVLLADGRRDADGVVVRGVGRVLGRPRGTGCPGHGRTHGARPHAPL